MSSVLNSNSNRMLICMALDERDFLRKKINDAIAGGKFIDVKRKRDEKLLSGETKEEFEKRVTSEFQSISDSIKRYHAIDRAITLSNATEMVTINGVEMTRAEAIALRKTVSGGVSKTTSFEVRLIDELTRQYNNAIKLADSYNQKANAQSEEYRQGLSDFDSKGGKKVLSEEDSEVISRVYDKFAGELINPIGIENKIKELTNDYNTVIKDIDSAIKVSNATTYITLE